MAVEEIWFRNSLLPSYIFTLEFCHLLHVCSTLLWYLAFEVRDHLVMFREFCHKQGVQEALFQSSPD